MDDTSVLLKRYKLSKKTANMKVRRPPSDDVGDIISVDMWEELLPYLDIPHDVVKWIHPNWTMKQKADYFFYDCWKERKGSGATYRKLVTALLRIQKKATAVRVCKLLQQHDSLSTAPLVEQQETPREPSLSTCIMISLVACPLLRRSL